MVRLVSKTYQVDSSQPLRALAFIGPTLTAADASSTNLQAFNKQSIAILYAHTNLIIGLVLGINSNTYLTSLFCRLIS
jgi:hypothetical protein